MAVAEIPTRNERQAYQLLRGAFIAAPIVAGFDKFTDKLGNWDRYLSDGVAERLPMRRHTFMKTIGAIEMAAGVMVAIKPKWGAPIVSAWLGGIVANMLTKPRYRDIALRDVGLAIGALALSRLANDMSRERVYREAA